jgi:hypothetical protein
MELAVAMNNSTFNPAVSRSFSTNNVFDTGTGGGGFAWDSDFNMWVTVTGAFPEAPATGALDGYIRNGATGSWQLITVLDGGTY